MFVTTELATSSELGVPLRDFDASNESDGEFKKINTLGHFHLHVMVSLAPFLYSIALYVHMYTVKGCRLTYCSL